MNANSSFINCCDYYAITSKTVRDNCELLSQIVAKFLHLEDSFVPQKKLWKYFFLLNLKHQAPICTDKKQQGL